MYVHGASTFDVVATPAPQRSNDNTMVYNGMASFEKDGHIHEYSLVDGTTYYTSRPNGSPVPEAAAGCLPAGSVPPIGSVLNAIHSATTAQSGGANSKCPGGSVMVFQFAGEDFVLCSSQSVQDGFQIYGKHLDIGVKYEQTAPVIVAPRVSTAALASCGKAPFGERIAPSLPSLLTRSFSEWSHRALRAEESQGLFDSAWDLITDSSCGCKGAQRACVFVAGLSSYDDKGLTEDDPEGYFGDEIGDHSPCCSSRKFITLATKENSWNDPVFQQRLVDLVVQVSGTSDPATGTIKDTIYVGHSMANLMLAGAIANKKASLDPSSTWVAASAPMEGSMGSNYIQESCNGQQSGFVASIIELLGDCPANTGETSLAYQGSNMSSQPLNDAYASAQAAYVENVDAVLCSNSYTGLVTVKAAIYALAGKILPHHSSENDGIVEYSSCTMGLPLDSFDNSYESVRYRSALNHVDTSFRNGDGVFSDSKKPLKWFECLL
ncbi:hypothetical protein DVH05_017429 [Phytophthora capsici]|nr:hypothetical protein DVH05_017429 [Phytophthora capsici]